MLKRTIFTLFTALALSTFFAVAGMETTVFAQDGGLIKKQSAHSVKKTLDRLEAQLHKKKITVVARVRHSVAAAKIGMKLADTELLIFGNPNLGSPLMMSNQEIGIDLPMKVLAYQDSSGQVWLAYIDPGVLKQRYAITDQDPVFEKMTAALNGMTDKAVAKE